MSNQFVPYSSVEAIAGRAHAHERHPRVSIRIDILMRYADATQALMKSEAHLGFIAASRRVMAGIGNLTERQAYSAAVGYMMSSRRRVSRGAKEAAAAEYKRRAHG